MYEIVKEQIKALSLNKMLTKLGQLRKRNLFLLFEGRELLVGHILRHVSTKGRPELQEKCQRSQRRSQGDIEGGPEKVPEIWVWTKQC